MRLALAGLTVVDATRMLPGALLARMLLDLGARVLKIESPTLGDPLRYARPLVDGVGAGFRAFYADAESVALDLSSRSGASALQALVRRADVIVESFRPGTLERWGLGPVSLRSINPALVVCSLSAFGQDGPAARRVGHDLNFIAESGLLSLLPGSGVPRVQLADASGALVACSAILAALFQRSRTGEGAWLDRPLAGALAPLLALAWAEAGAGGGGLSDGMLAGGCPAYALYECADGRSLAVGALEPKFWTEFVEAIGLGDLARDGLDLGERGHGARQRVAARIVERPLEHWLELASERNLPLSAVESLEAAASFRHTGETKTGTAPRLGEHTRSVLVEFGLTDPALDMGS